MMPRAAGAPSRESAAAAAWTPASMVLRSRCTPITPVDDTSTCSEGQPSAAPVSAAVARAVSSPWLPVQAFAQPLFTITARTCPREAARLARDTCTGAACTWFVVKSAAADAG